MKICLTFLCLFFAIEMVKGTVQVRSSQYIPPNLYVKKYTLTQSGSGSGISTAPYITTTEYSFTSSYGAGSNLVFSGNENDTYYGTPYPPGWAIIWLVTPPNPYSLNEQISESGIGYLNEGVLTSNIETEVESDVNFLGEFIYYSTNINASLPMDLENANFSGSRSFVGAQETVNRNAVTIMKLQTGGTKTSKAHNLFAFGATATQVAPPCSVPVGPFNWADPFAIYQYYGPTNEATIASQNISIGNYGKQVEGDLYCVLPDNDDVVVTPTPTTPVLDYTFSLSEQKFRALVQANSAILRPNNVVSNANFCVGQQINLSVVWSPYSPLEPYGFPEGEVGPVQWVLDGTFVNTNISPTDVGGSTNYVDDPDLLKGATASAWWISGGFSPVTYKARVGEGLTCPNGQYVTVPASGLLTMYKPQAKITTSTTSVNIVDEITYSELAFYDPPSPGVTFSNTISINPEFSGAVRWIQVVSNPVTQLEDTNQVWHVLTEDGPSPYGDYPIPYTAIDDSGNPYDEPSLSLPSDLTYIRVSASDNFEMWMMFQPSNAGSILVPLRAVNWYWSGSATNNAGTWELLTGTNSVNPIDFDAQTFPEWNSNVTNLTYIPPLL